MLGVDNMQRDLMMGGISYKRNDNVVKGESMKSEEETYMCSNTR